MTVNAVHTVQTCMQPSGCHHNFYVFVCLFVYLFIYLFI